MSLHRRHLVVSGLVLASTLAAQGVAAQDSAPPLPPRRPDAAERPAGRPPASQGTELKDTADGEVEFTSTPCLETLSRYGMRFEPRPPITEGDCRVESPVLVSRLPDGLAVSPPALMTCAMAEGLARWTLDTLLVEADRHFGTAPTKLLIGTSYECRNQRSGAKLSEHAFGNGVDVMGLEFHKRAPVTIGVHADGSPEAVFQEAIRTGACTAFTTVLGPGSDAAHGDHLHLDMRGRRGGYRICQ